MPSRLSLEVCQLSLLQLLDLLLLFRQLLDPVLQILLQGLHLQAFDAERLTHCESLPVNPRLRFGLLPLLLLLFLLASLTVSALTLAVRIALGLQASTFSL